MTPSPAAGGPHPADPPVRSSLVVVLNPAAGSGRAGRVWERLRARRPELAAAALIAEPDPERASAALAGAIAAALARAPTTRCVAIGGDGTLHWVANRVLADGHAGRVELALVPAGTGSDFARCLGLPREPSAALDQALDDPARPLDVLRVTPDHGTVRWVMNIASAGLSGLVDEKVNAIRRRNTFTFLLATLRALGAYTPVALRVTVDGEPWFAGKSFLLAVCNGSHFGKGMRVAPRAVVDDGLAEVVAVGDLARWQIPLRLPRIYLGTHLEHRQVSYRRGRSVRIEPAEPLPPFDVDGEVMPSGAATVELMPSALRFVH